LSAAGIAVINGKISRYQFLDSERTDPRTIAERTHPSERVLQLLNRPDAESPKSNGQFPCVFATIAPTGVHPQVGKCELPIDRSGPVDLLETDLRYGAFVLKQSDLYLNDVFEVPLTRTYSSHDYINPNPVHAFGRNTNHPYDLCPVGTRFPYTYQMLGLEDGNFLYFPRVSEGSGYADAIFQHTNTSTSFYKAVTAWNGNGWTTWKADGTTILFPDSYDGKNTAQGAVFWVRDGHGNVLQLMRDSKRNLQQILTPHNRWIKLQYDNQSRITRAEDDQGKSSSYWYNANGILADAVLPSGHARHYLYDGDLMVSVTDENGKVLVRNSYLASYLVRQEFEGGQVFTYRYRGPASRRYADAVAVTAPDGRKFEIATTGSIPEMVKAQSTQRSELKREDGGESLETTLKFMEQNLNGIDPINFVAYAHDTATGQDWTMQQSAEYSNVRAHVLPCLVGYHYKQMQNGAVSEDHEAWIPLDGVAKIEVMREEQHLNSIASAYGHSTWTYRLERPLFVMKASRFDSDVYNALVFSNEDLANRVAKAMIHAVELCGGGTKGTAPQS
jgi:YD repeat-containing protein